MITIQCEVVQSVKVLPGGYLDGSTVDELTWVTGGTHEFDEAYVTERGYIANGYVVPLLRSACCC